MPSLTPNSLASLLESTVSTRSSLLGRAAHAQTIKTLLSTIPSFLANYLINMYSKLDLPNSAHLVLQLSPTRSVVTWTTPISGFVQNDHFSSVLLHFFNMRRENIQPNDFTFPCAFKVYASLRLPLVGRQVNDTAVKYGQINDVFVGCSAFDMYSKTGIINEAHKLFDKLPKRNVATWNAYISNAVLDGRPRNVVNGFIEFCRVGREQWLQRWVYEIYKCESL